MPKVGLIQLHGVDVMKKSYPIVVLVIIMVILAGVVTRLQYNQQVRNVEVLRTEKAQLENTVKDLERQTNELINKTNELESKLTDQLQQQEQMKEQYEQQLRDKDKQIEALKAMKVISLRASAYTANCAGCSGFTALGYDIRKSTPKIIAVDPRIIKLGSKVEVFVNGESWGVYTAGDTGGAIKGYKCDILMSNHQDAMDFGIRNIKVRVLSEPSNPVT